MNRGDFLSDFSQRRVVPFAVWRHHPVDDQSADGLADATLAFQSRFPSDVVKITPASSYQLRDLGQEDFWRGDRLGRRDFGAPRVSRIEDWLELIDTPRPQYHLSVHLAAARRLRARIQPGVPLVQTVFDPMFQARTLARGVWEEHLRSAPEVVEAALDALTARTVQMIGEFREIGVDGIFLAIQNATEDDYLRIGLPRAVACLDASGGNALNLVHLHGTGHAGRLAAAFGDAIIHASFDDNPELVAEASRHPDIGLAGGLSPDDLATKPACELFRQVEVLADRMKGREFLLGASCVLRPETPAENIDAVMAAARRRGGRA